MTLVPVSSSQLRPPVSSAFGQSSLVCNPYCGRILLMSLIIIHGLITLTTAAPPADAPRAIKPIMTWAVSVGPQVKGVLGRCDTETEWQTVLDQFRGKHDGTADWSRPDVDFGANMVVVICHADEAAGTQIFEVAEDATKIRVRYKAGGIQTGLPPDDEAERSKQREWLARQYTFRTTFVVLPASRKPIVFEQGVGGTINMPNSWKERARVEISGKK
jgi:hypothetical protein